jgi:hypothetical protein
MHFKYENFDAIPKPDVVKIVRKKFHDKPILAGAVMPIRGEAGFRQLDYDYCRDRMNVKEIMDRLQDTHMNALGVVIKDTDGACLWNTKVGWNPTGRDVLGEFMEEGKERGIEIICSLTSMNDAYQGHIHPERASIHGKNGKNFKIGDVSTHFEGEMRVIPAEGKTIADYQKWIPFLSDVYDPGTTKAGRGRGYRPYTTFMCPNSEHVDYLIDLIKEVVTKYRPGFMIADYIRYDGSFTDLCACERCRSSFAAAHPGLPFGKGSKWLDWREDNIARYAQRFQDAVKGIDPECITGWFPLTGPPIFTRNRIAQNWTKLSSILDISSPMVYPYLAGTELDGWKWKKLGDLSFWYSINNMKHRLPEFKNPVFVITNSVECSAREMMKQVREFNYGVGIALFKYEGTTEDQWAALKDYAVNELGL